jgi:ADP-ribosylglycohydrolase
VKDIISKGGDTRSNAAIVGGLIGATNGISEQQVQFVEGKEQGELVSKIV